MVLSGLVVASLAGVGVTANQAWADVTCPEGSIRGDAGESASSYAECNLPKEETERTDLMQTVVTIINVIVGVVGIVAVIVIVLGAVSFVTSQGDAAKVTKGKNTILYGVIGLVVSLLAFAIVNFVLSAVFSGGSTSTGEGEKKDQESSQEEKKD